MAQSICFKLILFINYFLKTRNSLKSKSYIKLNETRHFYFYFFCSFLCCFSPRLGIRSEKQERENYYKDAIAHSNSLADLIEGYPANWVKDFISVEILASDKVNSLKAVGQNEQLNPDQKRVLSTAKLDSEVAVNVWYKSENSVTEQK